MRRPGTMDASATYKARYSSPGIAPSPSMAPATPQPAPAAATAGAASSSTRLVPQNVHTPLASNRSYDKSSEERRRSMTAAVSAPLSSSRKAPGTYPIPPRDRGFNPRETREGRESRERSGYPANEEKHGYAPRDANDYYDSVPYHSSQTYYANQQAYWDGDGRGGGPAGDYRGYDYDHGYQEASMHYDYRDGYYPAAGYNEAPQRAPQHNNYNYRDRDGRERELRRMRRGDGF